MNTSLLGDIGAVRKIAVLRALVLGDTLAATPFLRALRHAFPGAEIGLIGLPGQRALVERLPSVDRFIEFPGYPGLPERDCDPQRVAPFYAAMRAERFDLAIQLHGSGPIVNTLVHRLRARRNAGFFVAGGWFPAADRALFRAWPESGSEAERLLLLADHLGLRRRGSTPDFPLRDGDRAALAAVWSGAAAGSRYVCVHPGAQLPSRRWPAERFAAVADAVAASGATIVLTGTDGEAPLVAAVKERMRHAAVDLCGRTTLWTLGALVERAALVVCNDTGISHVAAALGTPSVVVSSGSDVARWAPADARRHRVLWSDVPCRPCAHAVCPYGQLCARNVSVGAVAAVALSSLDGASGTRPARLIALPVREAA